MKTLKTSAFAILCLLISFTIALAGTPAAGQTAPQTAAQKPDKKEILVKARQSYYVLKNQGLKSFQCMIQPSWKQLVEYLTQKPVRADNPELAKLNTVQYSAVIDEQGSAKITPFRPPGADVDSS